MYLFSFLVSKIFTNYDITVIFYFPPVSRDMPRAITIGISLTTVCYLMVNVAYITVLGKTGILASEAVAVVSLKT